MLEKSKTITYDYKEDIVRVEAAIRSWQLQVVIISGGKY